MSERLDKRVAQGFLLTRSEARQAVRQGRVRVDDVTWADPSAHVPQSARVCLDGQAPAYGPARYIMLNKPAGYLSATEDSRGPTVLALLPPALARAGLGVCGRLDKDSEGLLLLVSDGELNHRLTAPRYGVEKVYRVLLDAPAGPEDAAAFAAGIALSDFAAAPARLEIGAGDGRRCTVTLREGKYHQVKRMFAARGRTVLHLERVSIAGLALDGGLPRGGWRSLTEDEIEVLRRAVGIITKNCADNSEKIVEKRERMR